MPKIKKITFTINQEFLTLDLFYNTKNKYFFYKGLPSEFTNISKFDNMGNTEEQLYEELVAARRIYYERKKRQRLVIGFYCIASSELTMNKVEEGNYSGLKKNVSRKIGMFHGEAPLLSFGIEYGIFNLTEGTDRKTWQKVNPKTMAVSKYENDVSERYQMIDYTPERYAFFESINQSMCALVEKMSMFFGADQKKIIQLIESQVKLLS